MTRPFVFPPHLIEADCLPISDARRGDPDAWGQLFRRHQAGLCAFAVRLLKDEHTALDVLQETFLSAIRHIESLREDAKFGSWIYGIAYQKCLQHLRRARPVQSAEGSEVEPEWGLEDSPEQMLIRKEDETAFLALVDELPLPHRTCVLLFYLEDFSLEEVATMTETNVGTVKSRLHYARKTLRKRLEHRV